MPRWTSKDLDKMVLDKLDRKKQPPEMTVPLNPLDRIRQAVRKGIGVPKLPKV